MSVVELCHCAKQEGAEDDEQVNVTLGGDNVGVTHDGYEVEETDGNNEHGQEQAERS